MATRKPISAFKLKEEEKKDEPKKEGFIKSLAKDAAGTLVVKPALNVTRAGLGLLGRATGSDALVENATKKQTFKVPLLGDYTVGGEAGARDVASTALKSASYLAPYGTVARGAGAIANAAFKAPKAAALLGWSASGAGGGYAIDISSKLDQGQKLEDALKPGAGTLTGALIPFLGPVAKGGGVLAREALGASTGTGGGVIKKALSSSAAGGEEAKAFRAGLRGKTTPEQLVTEARTGLSKIMKDRTDTYVSRLSEISKNKTSLDIEPILESIQKNLDDFNIRVSPEGAVDFSRSTLRFNTKAQKEIETIVNEMKGFGLREGDRTAVGVDSLERAFGDLYSESSQARAFVQSVKKSTRDILSKVEGFDELKKGYAESTGLIKEIQKGLSLNNRASVDTAFRKLTSSLRINNEFRRNLVKELDEASGGFLTAKIAGQQLSEVLPRGLTRNLAGVGAGAGVVAGVGLAPLLKVLVFTSPRLVGEFLNAAGIPKRIGGQLLMKMGVLEGARLKTPGDAFLESKLANRIYKKAMEKGTGPGLSIKSVSGEESGLISSLQESLKNAKGQLDRVGEASAQGKVILKNIKDLEDKIYKAQTGKPTDVLKQPNQNKKKVSSTFTKDKTTGRFTGSESSATQSLMKEASKYKSAEEFVKAQFSKKPEYGMSHRPTYEGMPPAYNLLEGDTLPRDVYTHPDFSIATGRIRSGDKAANESWKVLKEIKGDPEADVTLYRAGAQNKLNSGDWVTFSKDYAKQSVEGSEKVYSFKAKAKDVIFAGDDINEFGYYPKSQLTEIWNKAKKPPKQ